MESKEGRWGWRWSGEAGRGAVAKKGTKEGQESDFPRWPAEMMRQMCMAGMEMCSSNMQKQEKRIKRGSGRCRRVLFFSSICMRLSLQIPLCSVSAATRLCPRFISPCLTLLTFSFPHLHPYFSNGLPLLPSRALLVDCLFVVSPPDVTSRALLLCCMKDGFCSHLCSKYSKICSQ